MGLGSRYLSESLSIGVHMVIEDRELIDTMELKGMLCFDQELGHIRMLNRLGTSCRDCGRNP